MESMASSDVVLVVLTLFLDGSLWSAVTWTFDEAPCFPFAIGGDAGSTRTRLYYRLLVGCVRKREWMKNVECGRQASAGLYRLVDGTIGISIFQFDEAAPLTPYMQKVERHLGWAITIKSQLDTTSTSANGSSSLQRGSTKIRGWKDTVLTTVLM